MSRHAAVGPKKFSQMNQSEKFVFVLKCIVSVLTLCLVYPNVLTGEDR